MLKKFFCLVLLLISIQTVIGQDYIDLFKINNGSIYGSDFSETPIQKDIDLFELTTTIPIPLSEKTAILTGVDYSFDNITLVPFEAATSLQSFTVKLGLNLTHSDKLTGTYAILPKIASERLRQAEDAFFIGGLAILNYKVSDQLTWRFGILTTTEAFGTLVSPIAGLYYQSKNKKWEMDAYLPGRAQLDYSVGSSSSIGAFFQAPLRSYVLDPDDNGFQTYVQAIRVEVGPYFEQSLFKNMLLLRVHGGYSSLNYEEYAVGDELDLRLSAIDFGDDRTRLTPEDTQGAFFLRFGATFRLHLKSKQ